MSLDFSKPGDCKITMDGYVDDLLRLYSVEGVAASPVTVSLFETPTSSEPLKPKQRQDLHSAVAKLLYLAKRVRPDILLAVSYLATRVTMATDADQVKLTHLLKYVNGSRDLGLILSFDKGMPMFNYVDVAFGVHTDGKSPPGAGTSLGKGIFDAKSTKQRLVTKSSTEAELVGTSDYASEILHKRSTLSPKAMMSDQLYYSKTT